MLCEDSQTLIYCLECVSGVQNAGLVIIWISLYIKLGYDRCVLDVINNNKNQEWKLGYCVCMGGDEYGEIWYGNGKRRREEKWHLTNANTPLKSLQTKKS